MWDSPDSLLKELIDPRTDPARKREVYQSLQQLGTTKEQSVLGGALGGLGLGALAAAVGVKAGRRLSDYIEKKSTGFGEETGKGTAEILNRFTLDPDKLAEFEKEKRAYPAGEEAFYKAYGKDAMGNAAAFYLGLPGAAAGSYLGGDMLGSTTQYQGAEKALSAMNDPNISAEEKKKLSAQYQEHIKRVGEAGGSGLLSSIAGMGVQLPMAAYMNYAGGKKLGKWLIPDEKLPTSGFANTRPGSHMMGELGFDTVVANPAGGAASALVFNATRSPYESPFDE